MDRKITSRLNMANAVKEVCDTRTDVVALVPAFVLLVASLQDRITALRGLMKPLTKKTDGFSEDKTNWKAQLSLLLSVVCGAGVSYSRKIKDVVMEKSFGFAETILSGMRDTELIETASSIIELQSTVATELKDYGITAELMAEVTDALAKFEAKNTLPIVNIYTGEADRNEALDYAFELSDFILQDMMKAALIYKVLDPNFYQSLDNASRISKVGIRHDQDPADAAARKEAREQKKAEAKLAKEAKIQAKDASNQQGTTEKKEVRQQPANASELLENNLQDMNAATEATATPAVQEPSLNGA